MAFLLLRGFRASNPGIVRLNEGAKQRWGEAHQTKGFQRSNSHYWKGIQTWVCIPTQERGNERNIPRWVQYFLIYFYYEVGRRKRSAPRRTGRTKALSIDHTHWIDEPGIMAKNHCNEPDKNTP